MRVTDSWRHYTDPCNPQQIRYYRIPSNIRQLINHGSLLLISVTFLGDNSLRIDYWLLIPTPTHCNPDMRSFIICWERPVIFLYTFDIICQGHSLSELVSVAVSSPRLRLWGKGTPTYCTMYSFSIKISQTVCHARQLWQNISRSKSRSGLL